jgi:hypothetical protein
MAFGDGEDDQTLHDAWAAFCDLLRAAGEQAFKDHNPATGPHRADAFRFLTQNLGQAFDLGLETKDPRYPLLHAFSHPTRKRGAPPPSSTSRSRAPAPTGRVSCTNRSATSPRPT